jgi:hypothetical protein
MGSALDVLPDEASPATSASAAVMRTEQEYDFSSGTGVMLMLLTVPM